MGNLTLKATLQLIDRVTRPLQAMSQATKRATEAFNINYKALKQLNSTASDVNGFKTLQSAIGKTQTELKLATEKQKKLTDAFNAARAPTQAMKNELQKAEQATQKLALTESKQLAQLAALKSKLAAAGFETKGFAASEAQLATRIAAATAALEAQRIKLKQVEVQQQKMNAIKKAYGDKKENLQNLKSGGVTAAMTGAVTLGLMAPLVNAAKHWEQQTTKLRVTGLDQHVIHEFQDAARNNTVKGISQNAALEALTEAQIIMRDPHDVMALKDGLFKAQATLESLYKSHGSDNASGDASEQTRAMVKVIEQRGGAANIAAFKEQQSFMMKAILGSGGVLKPSDWLQQVSTGGAAGKMSSNEDFYYVMGHLMQESGGFRAGTGDMASFTNIALGRTTAQVAKFLAENNLIDKSKVDESSKTDRAMLKQGGVVGEKQFVKSRFGWLNDVYIPHLQQTFKNKNGRDATDDEMKMLLPRGFSNIKAGQAFMQMYMERGNIARQVTAYRGSNNLQQGYDAAYSTTTGHEDELRAKFDTLKTQLGTTLLPLYIKAIEVTLKMVQSLDRFSSANPATTKFILYTTAALAGLLVVVGSIVIALTSILLPMAALRFSMAILMPSFWAGTLAAGRYALSILGVAINTGIAAAGMAGSAIFSALGSLAVGLYGAATAAWALMAPFLPIILICAAVAAAAYLIYKNWDVLVAFFYSMAIPAWDAMKSGASSLADGLRVVGAAIFDSLTAPLRIAIDAANQLINGLNRIPNINIPLIQQIPIASGATGAPIIGATNRPIVAGGPSPLKSSTNRPYTINHAAPVININGAQDTKAVGAEVKRQLDAHSRAQDARARSSLKDKE